MESAFDHVITYDASCTMNSLFGSSSKAVSWKVSSHQSSPAYAGVQSTKAFASQEVGVHCLNAPTELSIPQWVGIQTYKELTLWLDGPDVATQWLIEDVLNEEARHMKDAVMLLRNSFP
ncbi:MAG TPA: hypothetical protein VFS42_01170 [Burkholderiaceae bacterium]|nr:hypothetical protein [Burkholderiaceae bacterium]